MSSDYVGNIKLQIKLLSHTTTIYLTRNEQAHVVMNLSMTVIE